MLDRDGQVADEVILLAPAEAEGIAEVHWYEHFCQVMDLFAARGRFAGEKIACSVTGQGGSFVWTDGRHRPVSGACSWTALADEAIVLDLVDTFGAAGYYRRTGWPPHGWLAACKLRQMVERGRIPDDARHIATVPDFVYAQLTGDGCTDITSAQITGLADFRGSRWSHDILDWAGIHEERLPQIVGGLGVLTEDVSTRWGRITLVTGSHDQYAAMEAAGLEKDTSVMLGAGTAWVLDGRTSAPLFDDERFHIHPGRDLHPGCYGFIVTLWQIGAGFDKLLARLGVPQAALPELEAAVAGAGVPDGPVTVDLDTGAIEPAGDAPSAVRRYMEWAGSMVAHALDGCGLMKGLERIVGAGGAMTSRLWPQVIADICGLRVEAVDCPHFTAYGAALHARRAVLGPVQPPCVPRTATVRAYAPQSSQQYRTWYLASQKPMLEAQRI